MERTTDRQKEKEMLAVFVCKGAREDRIYNLKAMLKEEFHENNERSRLSLFSSSASLSIAFISID